MVIKDSFFSFSWFLLFFSFFSLKLLMKTFNNRMEEQEERKRQKEWFRKGLALFNIFNEFYWKTVLWHLRFQ